MIHSSIMIENLIKNDKMISYFKFFSECLINESNILINLRKLEQIDEIFNEFIETVTDKNENSKQTVSIDMTSDEEHANNKNNNNKDDIIVKRLRWSDSLVESQKNEMSNGNISLIDTTMTTQDSLQNDVNLRNNHNLNNNDDENSYDNSIMNTSYNNNNNNDNNSKRSSFLLNRNFLTNDSS
ncbi:hypothetical protein C6P45_003950 [Maudiozyma exigua]|uniref:Uncharacterized protein n=1 Tax=Maudiozyma exigua TaxID=34358 RepID=A0A9P7B1I6_MAUEX|nr:hypothetical protein C6P45_003950 [Kazachstania exigua]